MRKKIKKFTSPLEAAKEWAQIAIPLTLESNREYSSLIIKTKTGCKLTKPRRGAHNNVILNALLGSFLNLFAEVYLIHTHTLCSCHIPDKFSGNPKHPIKEPGDITVIKVLGYKSIFLASPDGRIFELKRNYKIDNIEELRSIKPTAYVELSDNRLK